MCRPLYSKLCFFITRHLLIQKFLFITFQQAPQLLKKHVDDMWLGERNQGPVETVSLKQAQTSRAKEIIKSYETLDNTIKRHDTAIKEYVKHLRAIVSLFETILEDSERFSNIQVSSTVLSMENKINEMQTDFATKTKAHLDNLRSTLKPLGKALKEREYVQLDLDHYTAEFNKFERRGNDLQEKSFKKKHEYKQKVHDTKCKAEHLDTFLDAELPQFFQLSNALSKCLATIIFYHAHDLAKVMHDSFQVIEKYFPDLKLNNLYFEHSGNEVKKAQAKICERIDELHVFKHQTSIYGVEPQFKSSFVSLGSSQPNVQIPKISSLSSKNKVIGKVGTALYNFTGEKNTDLSFQKGSRVRVISKDPSGWWEGVLVGSGTEKRGVFPYNYFTFSEE